MADQDQSDATSYAPFLQADRRGYRALLLAEPGMEARQPVFAERQGWTCNGNDWGAIAETLVAERLLRLGGRLSFDPEAGMPAISGERADLEALGAELSRLHRDVVELGRLMGCARQD